MRGVIDTLRVLLFPSWFLDARDVGTFNAQAWPPPLQHAQTARARTRAGGLSHGLRGRRVSAHWGHPSRAMRWFQVQRSRRGVPQVIEVVKATGYFHQQVSRLSIYMCVYTRNQGSD
jgi:hypothetical protein